MADVTDATFGTAVLERSHTVPVIVDLWAPWCGPCKTLGPILEKVVGEAQGLVELAKVNVDENPQVAQAYQVQSIPAVYAMRDGQVVDGFMGAQGEPAVVEFVQRLIDASNGTAAADEAGDAHDDPAVPSGDDAEAEDAADALDPAEIDRIESELAELLTRVKGDDDARERFLELLEQLGAEHEGTNTWRRRLASSLY